MSAREDLLKVMAPGHSLDEVNSLIIADAVDEILAKHLHEIVEAIRSGRWMDNHGYAHGTQKTYRAISNLITRWLEETYVP